MAARWIARLESFNFAIVHRPGKHHSHADVLSSLMSRPCKRETCSDCRQLQQTVTSKAELARCCPSAFPYHRHFDGYVEGIGEDVTLFWEGDPDLNPQTEIEDSAPHPEAPLLSARDNNEMLAPPAPAQASDIDIPSPSAA